MKIGLISISLVCCLLSCSYTDDVSVYEQDITRITSCPVVLTGLRSSVAGEIHNAVEYVSRIEPRAVEGLSGIFVSSVKDPAGWDTQNTYTYTHIEGSKKEIILCMRSMGFSSESITARYNRDVWYGEHSGTSHTGAYTLIVHELGHIFDSNLGLYRDPDIISLYRKSGTAKNIMEFTAECFVDAVCNETPLSEHTVNFLKILSSKYR